MKFSKSILIFLFFSSLSGAFYYALKRTTGNVFKFLQFALFFLAIKIDRIWLNVFINQFPSPWVWHLSCFLRIFDPSNNYTNAVKCSKSFDNFNADRL